MVSGKMVSFVAHLRIAYDVVQRRVRMKEQERESLYKQLQETYGRNNQILKAIEELTELTHELCRVLAPKHYTTDYTHVLEETVDVFIMLEQIKLLFNFSDVDFNLMLYSKLNRTAKRLQEYLEVNNEHEGCTRPVKED